MLSCDVRPGRSEFIQRHCREAPGADDAESHDKRSEQQMADSCLPFSGHLIVPGKNDNGYDVLCSGVQNPVFEFQPPNS